MKVEPQKEHQWLQKLVGEWTCEGQADAGPDGKPMTWKSTESARSLAGVWVMCEGSSEMPDGSVGTTIMTLGFDPKKGRFVGTFIGSMMTNLWVYDGELDASGSVLTLNAEGPSMAPGGKTTQYKDIIEIKSDDHRQMKSIMLGEDGQWHQVMLIDYRRKA